MNSILYKTIFLAGIVLMPGGLSLAQPVDETVVLNSPLYREKLQVFADRSLYGSGEPVMFRAFNLSNLLLKENSWSSVLYLELINADNRPVARGKYRLKTEGAYGELMIPDTVSSGSYCLRAYTRWMRNFPASDYYHLPLTVINPRKISSEFSRVNSASTVMAEYPTDLHTGIDCATDRTSYKKREKVILEVKGVTENHSPDGYFISVSKEGYIDTDYTYMPDNANDNRISREKVLYYPETNGISVSGHVVGGAGRQAVSYSRIFLTLLGDDPDCLGYSSDEKGRMNFSLPYHTGSRDILITLDPEGVQGIEMIMDEEFSQDFARFPLPAVDFFHERRELAEELMLNSQIMRAFASTVRDSVSPDEEHSRPVFYGSPDFRYRTEDYIALPNLQEFFYELIPSVYLRRVKGKKYLTVIGEYTDLSYYMPLILLDYVPVWNSENILAVNPASIEYVDIINRRYIRGDNIYGGIISIVSKEGDRGGVELPSNSSFFSFSTLMESHERIFQDYDSTSGSENIPDLRTTLYWLPHIEISDRGLDEIEFFTSDIKGEYVVTIRGVTSEGRLVGGVCEFTVE